MHAKIDHRPDISVVIPAYNEEENARYIIEAAIAQLESCGVTFEIIVIDNNSSDGTVAIVKEVCARDSRVKLIVNSRNFGQMRSPTHAIYQARGRAVLGLAADFQDPPELIPQLVAHWQAGAEIVLCVRKDERSAGRTLKAIRALSYWLARNFSDYPLVPNATGFGIFDAKVVDATRTIAEPEPFLRGMLLETGYKVLLVPYDRPERAAGTSKNGFLGLLDFAMSALSGSSKRLLRIPVYFGVIGVLMTFAMLLGAAIAWVSGRPVAAWLIAAVVQAEFALLFGFLGLLGENLRLIAERTRNTPLVIERERINFGDQ